MRLLASEISLRWCRRLLLTTLLVLCSALCSVVPALGQNITLKSPLVERGNATRTTILFQPSDVVNIRWVESNGDLNLKIGQIPGTYGLQSIRMRGNVESSFSPEVVGLPVGVYYGVLTNATSNTFTEIQIEASTNPSIRYSTEFLFVVESLETPRTIAPRGTISEQVPVFEWDPVPGVVSYAIIVSSTPFTISESPTGDPKLEGVNPVWNHLTTKTAALYGEKQENNPLSEFNPLPLVPGETYYYAILNAYSKESPGLLSYVMDNVSTFTLENRGALTPADLAYPIQNTRIVEDDLIEFSWAPVEGAISYQISIYERIQDGLSTSNVQVFSGSTPNSFLSVSAKTSFRQGNYRWFVIANDREGAGSVSAFGTFRYGAEMGSFEFRTTSATTGEEILGVVVKGRSTDGGYNPPYSWVNSNASAYLDSLVVGNYEFKATKSGFSDAVVSVQIRKGIQTTVPIVMQPLPSRINGQVQDETGLPVENVTVTFTGVPSGMAFSTKTSAAGIFSIDLTPGTFRITATKAGYRASVPITVSVLENKTLSLPQPLSVKYDRVSVSGRVLNQDAFPISQVSVTATLGAQSHTIITNGEGRWSLDLSEGVWSISASKDGFLAPNPRELTLFAGDVLTNYDFILIQQASRVEGVALGVNTLGDGRIEQVALSGADVTAYPLYGPGITVKTDAQGRYVLDLGTGFYSIFVSADGFKPAESVDLLIRPNEIFRGINFKLIGLTSTVFGRVIDGNGVGVEGALVSTSAGLHTGSQSGGTFVLQISPEEQTIIASKNGLLPSQKQTLALGPHSEESGVVLRLLPNAADVSGTVRSKAGPLAGVRVVATSGSDSFETTTNSMGEYDLQLSGGSWQIRATSPRYRLPNALTLAARVGQVAESVDLLMVEDFIRVDGFVKNGPSGLSGAIVRAVDVDQSRGVKTSIKTISGTSGGYSALLSASVRYLITVDEAGFQPFNYPFTTDLPGAHLELDIPLEASQSVVTGKVQDADGMPVFGASIAVKVGGVTQFATTTSVEGNFQLNIEQGNYELMVSAPGYEATSLDLSLSSGQRLENVLITLESSQSTLIATIIDPRTGNPIAGAGLVANGPIKRTGISSPEGVVTFAGLSPGAYQISISAPGFLTVVRSVTFAANTTLRQTFVLVPVSGTVSGLVLDSNSNPIQNATVRLEGTTIERYAQTNANGGYEFSALPDGGYSISAQKSGYSLHPSVNSTVSISNRNTTAPIIRLQKASGVISGTVQDGLTGAALSGAVVIATSSFGVKSSRSNADGTFEITALEGGEWTLTAFIDNYRYTSSVVSVVNGQTTSSTIGMKRNQAVLTGRILSKTGGLLPFDTAVEVKTSREEHRVFTGAEGRFVIDQLPQNENVVLRTRIQRENYLDIERTYFLAPNETQLSLGDILIVSLASTISGSVGISGASISVLNTSGGTVAVATSQSNGTYKIPFLEAGSYEIVPSKIGHSFSPSRRTIAVGENETGSASFSVTSNLGLVTINVRTKDGTAVVDVPVRISSFDRTIDQTLRTDANGSVLPKQLPLGLRYRIEPVSTSQLFDPSFLDIDLGVQAEAVASFTAIGISSFLSGQTTDMQGTPISGVTVSAQSGLAQTYTAESVNGVYTLGPLPPGMYTVTGRKSGFLSASTSVTVSENATVSGIQLQLQRQSVGIKGRIVRSGTAVPNMTVVLSGPTTLTTTSDASGAFTFSNVPVSELGETAIEIAVQRPGRPAIVRRISVSNANVGQIIELESIILSSGSISVLLTDGTSPLLGIEVLARGSDGGVVQGVTNQDGLFETAAILDAGIYTIEILNSVLLQPPSSMREVILSSSESQGETTIVLPFSHTPQDIFRSDQPVPIIVGSATSQSTINRIGRLSYQLPGQEYKSMMLSLNEGTFSGSIPAPGEGKLRYFIEILDTSGAVAYRTTIFERTTIVAGQLQETRLFPDLNGHVLRATDQYGISLQIRDGLGVDISNEVSEKGQVEWVVISGDVGVDTQSDANKLTATITPRSDGSYALQVRITLGTRQILIPVQFEARSVHVSSLLINTQSTRVINTAGTARFSVSGQTTTGENVLLGNSVYWSVSPNIAASISQNGTVSTTNPKFVGPLQVSVVDAQSGAVDSSFVSVFAELNGSEGRTLTDYKGMEIFIPATSIPFRSEFTVSYPRTPTPKRFDSAGSDGPGLTSGKRTYRFSMRSDRALEGDSLAAPATLKLAQDPALALYEGEKQIGFFNKATLSWNALASFSSESSVVTSSASRLGDYGVVSTNGSLGIRHLEALPSPFSPDIAPLRIAYFLDTASPPATVSIHILNVRGELVKTVLDADQQWAGPYGGRNGLKQIEWDGTTNDNQKARNGRYIIRVTARDQEGSISTLLPIALVK